LWWYLSVIPTLGRLRKEDHKFEASLGYIKKTLGLKRKEKERKK
jgi:hypothetical protein